MLLSNAEYLQLIAESLSRDVAPELHSDSARATAQIAVDALRELVQREEYLPNVIARFGPQGIALAARVDRLLARPEGFPLAEISTLGEFGQLLEYLDGGAKKLLERSSDGAVEIADVLRDIAVWEEAYYAAFQASPPAMAPQYGGEGRPLTVEKLQRELRARLENPAIEVTDFQSVPGGFVNETFFFTLVRPGVEDEKLVIRKKSSDPFFTFWANRLVDEFEIVIAVKDAGHPVARPLWLFDLDDVDGAFYVMTRSQGRVAGSLRNSYSGGKALSERLMLNLARFLGRLHSIPLSHFARYLEQGDSPVRIGDTVAQAAAKNIDYLHKYWLHRSRLASPSEAYVLHWLHNNIPPDDSQPVLIHGDCFVHNLIVDDQDEITTVVDWESAHFGSPATDIAYIKDQVSHYIDWATFIRCYRDNGGPHIDETHFPYYKALMNFRNCWGTNISVSRVPQGYHDIRMIPLGSEMFAAFLKNSIESVIPAKDKGAA